MKAAYNIVYMGNQNDQPYAAFGARIKFLREQWQQTVDEVSGTLEIDHNALHLIESGKQLPSAEMLDMLISHFLLTEDQADDLRELAEGPQDSADVVSGVLEDIINKQVVMYMPIDNRVVYSDSMQANVNDNGVILQFSQQAPGAQQPTVVSRVGMSREHAEKVIAVLSQTLQAHDANKDRRNLPPKAQ